MSIPVSDSTKRARILHQFVGSTERIQLRHVPSDWVIVSIGRGFDLVENVEKFRRAAVRLRRRGGVRRRGLESGDGGDDEVVTIPEDERMARLSGRAAWVQ